MLIHLVYEEEYVEQLRGILESAGHTITEWDYSLSQFAAFSERKQVNAEIALVDGQAGVMTKREIIESLGKVRRNLPFLRLILVFPEMLERDEAFIAKLLTYSIYDMHFKDAYDVDDLENWFQNPKSYADYNVETQDIEGVLTPERPRIQGIEPAAKPPESPHKKTLTLPKLPKIEVKLPDFASVREKIPSLHPLMKKEPPADEALSWEEDLDPKTVSAENAKSFLGCTVWFWGEPSANVTETANQFAGDLSESVPVLLLDGNLENPGLSRYYDIPGPGWEDSWLTKTPGIPPEKAYAKGNLTVWLLQDPVDVADTADMWNVALYHTRSPKRVVVVDGGPLPPSDEADVQYPVGQADNGLNRRKDDETTTTDEAHSSENETLPGLLPLPNPDAASCEEAIAQALQEEAAFVLMVDSDGLKGINDKYGHATGTAYLTEVWDRLHAAFPDTLWHRYGGDEFYGVIVSHKASEADLVNKAKAITGMASIHGRDILVACSIGLYGAAKGESAIAAMAMADHAMYQVKKVHHGGVKVFNSRHCLVLTGEWPNEWMTVPVSEGWRVLVYPENTSPDVMPPRDLIVARKPIPGLVTPAWIPENEDIRNLVEKLKEIHGTKKGSEAQCGL